MNDFLKTCQTLPVHSLLRKEYFFIFFGVLFFSFSEIVHAQDEKKESPYSKDFGDRFNSIRSSIPQDLPYLIQRADSLLKDTRVWGEEEFIARANYLLGLLHYFNSEHYISQKYYLDALELEYVQNTPRLAKALWNNIGINYDLSNDIIRSLDAYKKAADFAQQIGDSSTIGRTYINRGLLYRKQRNFEDAKEITFKALDYYLPKQDSGYVMLCYQNLAIYELEAGNPDKNLEYNRKALPLARALKDKVTEHSVLSNMANAYLAKGEIKNAERYLTLARQNWKANDWLELTERMWNQEAKIELAKGNLRSAKAALDSSRAFIERFELVQYEDSWAETNLKYAARMRDTEVFDQALETYKEKRNERFDKDRQKTFEEMLVLYEAEKLESEKKELKYSLDKSNQQLAFLIVIVIISIIAIGGITSLYIRVKKQKNVLYQKVLENSNKECVAVPPTSSLNLEEEKDNLEELFREVTRVLREKKLYLNPKLSLGELANEVYSNERYVSQAINKYAQNNVSNFIHSYRIKHASRLLIENPNLTKDEIAEKAGFNSRSNFYKTFSQQTGLTPTEFTKMHKNREVLDQVA